MNQNPDLAFSEKKEESLYIIIPAYNEEANIETVAQEWHAVVEQIGGNSKLVVIDDGSKDKTMDILTSLSQDLPYLLPMTKPNSGHGATLQFGYQLALDQNADFIFQTDSDGQTLSREFQDFWNLRHQYDAIIGHRNQRQDGWSRIFVTKVLKFVLLLVFKENIKDANTPFRLMNQNILSTTLPLIPPNFNLSNVLLTVLMVRSEAPILFLPVTFRERQGGVNSLNFKKIIKIGRKAFVDFRDIQKTLKQIDKDTKDAKKPPLKL